MPPHDGQHGRSRGPESGSFLAVVPEDRNFSRRISLFHLVAPDGGERRPDAAAEERSFRGPAGRDHGDRRGVAEEGTGSAGPVAGGGYRPAVTATRGSRPTSRLVL